jgi:hypothetical protein
MFLIRISLIEKRVKQEIANICYHYDFNYQNHLTKFISLC